MRVNDLKRSGLALGTFILPPSGQGVWWSIAPVGGFTVQTGAGGDVKSRMYRDRGVLTISGMPGSACIRIVRAAIVAVKTAVAAGADLPLGGSGLDTAAVVWTWSDAVCIAEPQGGAYEEDELVTAEFHLADLRMVL
jgi:hypothetical protein